ncbi:MAG: Hsp20/alpha crystallin family protein [Candidatus Bathyarchaeota archaeon]|nr:Hsp20/alpha crystallin family protein [Candidatus Bathyarchaeota archaeon]MDH5733428.1 Hsp20/alpha crystallin family protein [Candidatus Bathyarchaeota archaeon]
MSYIDEFFRDTDSYFRKLAERMFREMSEIETAIRSGKLKGEWDIKPIKEPGVKGYVAKGRFQLGEPLKFPKQAIDEVREPLTDVFEDKDHVKLYIELPGVEKGDIQLNITESQVEVKAKNFYNNVKLPTRDVEFDKASANYKNGVLQVIIPKIKKVAKEEKKKTIKID